MEPRIQYAKTKDGVSIAFWALGEGVPLVLVPVFAASHLQMEWQVPERRAAYEQLAERAMVIRYDRRGMGMSQRDAIDFSLTAADLDLDAVIDRLGLASFALLASGQGDIAFAYAARHPERVTRVALWLTRQGKWGRDDPKLAPILATIDPLIDLDWDIYVQIWVRLQLGWEVPAASQRVALIQASHSPASFRAAWVVVTQRRADEFLPAVHAPTLILHRLGDSVVTDAASLASKITNAHLTGIPGPAAFPYPNEIGIAAVLDFINAEATAPGQPIGAPDLNLSAVRAILWTDIEEHSTMMDRLGDAKGRDVLREHERITREALAAHGGAEVKAMGDGFMAWFPSTQKALECAVALQRAFAAHNETASEPVLVRVGVNAGEPIAEEDDLFGASVIAAARVCRAARGGEIVVADVVRQLVAGKNFLFADRGEVALRGFEDPLRLYEVRWREDAG